MDLVSYMRINAYIKIINRKKNWEKVTKKYEKKYCFKIFIYVFIENLEPFKRNI